MTPLAPHSLSFRPIILHQSADVRIEKVKDNRGSAWVSLDGANRFRLGDGESIMVSGAPDFLNLVILKSDNLTDLWAQRLVKFFGWNTREQNKPLMKKSQALYAPTMEDYISPLKNSESPGTQNSSSQQPEEHNHPPDEETKEPAHQNEPTNSQDTTAFTVNKREEAQQTAKIADIDVQRLINVDKMQMKLE